MLEASYAERAAKVLCKFFTDYDAAELSAACESYFLTKSGSSFSSALHVTVIVILFSLEILSNI